ncbi:MAG: hypothetical protein RBU23_02915 [Candidatus Auribacterota bacterium]|jgi:hypothetical protein|nr:hypothetical protein [Candidatus Auribacterota bacterium]
MNKVDGKTTSLRAVTIIAVAGLCIVTTFFAGCALIPYQREDTMDVYYITLKQTADIFLI